MSAFPSCIKLTGGDLRRTANVPTQNSFTACGWSAQTADLNTISVLWSLEDGVGGGGLGIFLLTAADGTNLSIAYSGHSGLINFQQLTLNEPFFWAVTCSGTATGTLIAYFRKHYQTSFTVTPSNDARTSMTAANFMLGSDSNARPFSGMHWSYMVWDRVLTPAELLKQSYYSKPLNKTSLNLWCPLSKHLNIKDYGPNGRTPVQNGGTLTTQRRQVVALDETRTIRQPLYLASSPSAVKFRKTMSGLGTQVGARRPQFS